MKQFCVSPFEREYPPQVVGVVVITQFDNLTVCRLILSCQIKSAWWTRNSIDFIEWRLTRRAFNRSSANLGIVCFRDVQKAKFESKHCERQVHVIENRSDCSRTVRLSSGDWLQLFTNNQSSWNEPSSNEHSPCAKRAVSSILSFIYKISEVFFKVFGKFRQRAELFRTFTIARPKGRCRLCNKFVYVSSIIFWNARHLESFECFNLKHSSCRPHRISLSFPCRFMVRDRLYRQN